MLAFRKIIRDGFRPERSTISLVLRALARSSLEKAGESVHGLILRIGYSGDLILSTGLIDFYAKIGNLPYAIRMFDEMPEKDIIANNSMISTLCSHGLVAEARKLFDGMSMKSSATWNSMITGYCKRSQIDDARHLFDLNPLKDTISWNTMIDGYCKSGNLDPAIKLFHEMSSSKNSITWNTMITGYVHHRQFSAAVFVFRQMQAARIPPTAVTMVSLLSACAHLGALDMGRWIHGYICSQRLRIDAILGNALVDMYCKCGAIEVALQVFRGLPERNVFCWNSIICGLGMQGRGDLVIETFLEMQQMEGIKPDGVTFVGLLSGFSHSGMVTEGKKYFSQMSKVYGVAPEIEHFGCMVDLLGRAGLLREALNLIHTMPVKPNSVVWGSLLRACKIHRDLSMSEEVARQLVAIDPRDSSNYVLLSNIYASASRWEEVVDCRKVMAESGIRKVPGCSLIEVDNIVHEFTIGDESHPDHHQIVAFLEEIDADVRASGYLPDVDSVLHDIEEEEKEHAVKFHSEKVAVVFGILKTSPGVQIRVVKNLRICADCHEFLKVMAKLFNREIIIRDRSRFHRFIDGTCSCRDFW